MDTPDKTIAPPTPVGNRAQRRIMEKTAKFNREFSYSLSGVNLNFTLRIDTDTELLAFRECIIEAMQDIDGELAKLKK